MGGLKTAIFSQIKLHFGNFPYFSRFFPYPFLSLIFTDLLTFTERGSLVIMHCQSTNRTASSPQQAPTRTPTRVCCSHNRAPHSVHLKSFHSMMPSPCLFTTPETCWLHERLECFSANDRGVFALLLTATNTLKELGPRHFMQRVRQ
jgi:hypothetical protein